MITIDDKSGNPITEHKVDILSRLNPNMIIPLVLFERVYMWVILVMIQLKKV